MHVAIVLTDRGWIIEQLADKIASQVPGVTYDETPDERADVLYYMTYSARKKPSDKIEIGYFTHIETGFPAEQQFHDTAQEVDYCVCHAELYANILRQRGVDQVHTIAPGVDLDHFTPKLRIGVVGRTYHTGRKGEHIVQQLMDLPFVEWRFTGEGWPGPALKPSFEDLPDFYRDLDYVLVPALYEAGPMCVIEALACGIDVIAPPIGWVTDFPHIEYPTGDIDALRTILEGLHEQRLERRRTVEAYTWENWAQSHRRLFESIGREHGLGPLKAPAGSPARQRRSVQILHGNEARSQGGPSVRVPMTVQRLRERGQQCTVASFPHDQLDEVDLAHVYNIWQPATALAALGHARRHAARVVFSPIFLDLTGRPLWQQRLPNLAHRSTEDLAAGLLELAEIARRLEQDHDRLVSRFEPSPGYIAGLRQAVGLSDTVICLSEHEKSCLERICGQNVNFRIVHNPVDAAAFDEEDADLFCNSFGLSDYVLCVGRIEPRKNQLMLAMALADSGIPLVLVGHIGDQEYAKLVFRHGGDSLHHIDRLPPNSPMLRSAYLGARVFTLPSWCEGASLAALEAAASGVRMVLSTASSEREYFGDMARFVHPIDAMGWYREIGDAFESPHDGSARLAQRAQIAERFGWQSHIDRLEAVHDLTLSAPPRAVELAKSA